MRSRRTSPRWRRRCASCSAGHPPDEVGTPRELGVDSHLLQALDVLIEQHRDLTRLEPAILHPPRVRAEHRREPNVLTYLLKEFFDVFFAHRAEQYSSATQHPVPAGSSSGGGQEVPWLWRVKTRRSKMATIRCPSCKKLNRVGQVSRGTPRCGSCKVPLPWVVDAGDGEFEQEATASVPVLVDLWAPWCGPCRMVSPALERLANKYAGRLKLVKVNVDEAPRTARRFDSRSIPTLAILRDGREVERTVGAAPEARIDAWLSRHINQEAASDAAGNVG